MNESKSKASVELSSPAVRQPARAPAPPTSCPYPGEMRQVDLQPIFFRSSFDLILDAYKSSAVDVFLVDNDMTWSGGAGTINSGSAAAQIVMSDRGASDTLLAHELGHVLLGDGHPPATGDPNTIMEPSRSHSTANPVRNTIGNYQRIVWPVPSGSTCLQPDP